jgi:hypothetical protein
VDIEVITVETHLQELVFDGAQAAIAAFLKSKVSNSTYILHSPPPPYHGQEPSPHYGYGLISLLSQKTSYTSYEL